VTDETLTTDAVVAAYVKLRDAIKEREAAHQEEITGLKMQLDALSANLLDRCNEQNADSIRTAGGTVSRRLVTRYWTNDWESMYNFIDANNAYYLLERRINHNSMNQFLAENPELLPQGLQSDRKYTVQVRRPTNK